MTLIWGKQPVGKTLLWRAKLRGTSLRMLLDARENMLPLLSVSEWHEARDTDDLEVVVEEAEKMEPLLWFIIWLVSFRSVFCCISPCNAKCLLPISGGLVGQSGRQPVTTKGLWMLVVMRTMWSKTPLSWGSWGKLKVNVDFKRWATFCPALFLDVAFLTSSLRSGHSGTYASQNCSARGRLDSCLSRVKVSKCPVFCAHSLTSFLRVASTELISAPKIQKGTKEILDRV